MPRCVDLPAPRAAARPAAKGHAGAGARHGDGALGFWAALHAMMYAKSKTACSTEIDKRVDEYGAFFDFANPPDIRPLGTFIGRVLALPPARNVVVALFGEFCRTVADCNHEPGGTATVIGKYVKRGRAGPQTADGSPPPDSPPPAGLGAFLASVLKARDQFVRAQPIHC